MDIIERLRQEFHFNENELKLLQVLRDGSSDVKSLSQKSLVPMGRIYAVLQDLERKGLVVKNGHPAKYTCYPLEDRIVEFINREAEQFQRKKEALLADLKSSHPQMQIITDMAEYKNAYFDWISGGEFIYFVQVGYSLPLQFFPRSETEAVKVFRALNPDYIPMKEKRESRQQLWGHMRAFKNEKHLIDASTFHHYLESVDKAFGRDYLLERIRDTKRLMDLYGFEIRIRPALIASRVVITSKTVVLSTFLNNQIIAMKVDSPQTIHEYKKLFEELFSQSTSWERDTNAWLAAHPVK
ncbi:MAG: hypothetical protein IPJ89_03835 [Candidatus Iainarchaeum archaeon]|uniref:Transcription regulator TrmB N-terminal domain-containing protein n=1 Tax=Candidatus Iainarchaeum sp. TaxID=3101447 RepID=A0A7T9DJ46_9ARCH|nr:MAG: hypothetical protein IPJ89_03835 [Candidatus Diapherotrites archaeon]